MLFKAFVVSIMWSIDKTVDFFPRVSDVSYVVGLAAKKRTPKKTNLKFEYNVHYFTNFYIVQACKTICYLLSRSSDVFQSDICISPANLQQ